MRWISRAVLGWNVRMTVRGRRTSKFFGDAAHGGKAGALTAARAYRDELAASQPAKVPVEPKPLLVVRQNVPCYQIRIPKVGGGTSTTEFSTRLHGPRNARRMALDAYRAAAERAGLAVSDH